MPPRTKGKAKRPPKADDKTLKRKRENEDHERLKKAIDEFVWSLSIAHFLTVHCPFIQPCPSFLS